MKFSVDASTDAQERKGIDNSSSLPVFMFPGQGSQKLGMGSDLMKMPVVADTFVCASDIYGFDVAEIILDGSEDQINKTRFAQATVLTLSIALTCLLQEEGIRPAAVLGFSLGQIAALVAAGMLGVEETFALAKVRAEVMEKASEAHPGAMCALLGADHDETFRLCETAAQNDTLVIANYNCPGQIVISGTFQAVERAREAWSAQGKKAVILATAGAFHSPLMREAADEFLIYCEGLSFASPQVPLIGNTDAAPLKREEVAVKLSEHLYQAVLFQQSVEKLLGVGMRSFVEVGFGATLTGFVKRSDRKTLRHSVGTAEKLATYLSSQREVDVLQGEVDV